MKRNATNNNSTSAKRRTKEIVHEEAVVGNEKITVAVKILRLMSFFQVKMKMLEKLPPKMDLEERTSFSVMPKGDRPRVF